MTTQFLLGLLCMASAVAGLFFLRFGRRTRDRFFYVFAAAFWLLGLNWLLLAMTSRDEAHPEFYLLRLLAFVLIIAGIIDKNRAARTRG